MSSNARIVVSTRTARYCRIFKNCAIYEYCWTYKNSRILNLYCSTVIPFKMNIFGSLVILLAVGEGTRSDKQEDQLVESIYDSLQKDTGMRRTLSEVVLVLGNESSDRSVVAKLMTSNGDSLVSVRAGSRKNEYRIEDRGNVTTTIYPVKLRNILYGADYYVCPGFSDDRSPAEDIAAAYSIQKLIATPDRIKLLFVISYSSIMSRADRPDLLLFLKHASNIVKNVTMYRESIALAVTRVENIARRVSTWKMEITPDEKMRQSIVRNLLLMKYDVEILSLNSQSRNKNILGLIDAFIQEDEFGSPKIGVLRKPDEAGAVNEIGILTAGIDSLNNIIQHREFSSPDRRDFGHNVSPSSLPYIYRLSQLINTNVKSVLISICKHVEEHFNTTENLSHDVYGISESYKLAEMKLSKYGTRTGLPLTNLLKDIWRDMDDMQIKVSITDKRQLRHFTEQIDFLDSVNNNATEHPQVWLEGCHDTIRFLADGYRWFSFLTSLHYNLSNYSIQKDINENNLTSLVDTINAEHKVETVCKHVGELIKQVKRNSADDSLDAAFAGVQPLCPTVSHAKIKALKGVLNFHLIHMTEPVVESAVRLLIKGRYVKLSEIISKYWKDEYKSITIFATMKIFIDVDLQKIGDKQVLCMIAPIWEIKGSNAEIVVGGSEGGKVLGLVGNVVGGNLTISSDGRYNNVIIEDLSNSYNFRISSKPIATAGNITSHKYCLQQDATPTDKQQQQPDTKQIIDKYKSFASNTVMPNFGDKHVAKFYNTLYDNCNI